MKVLGIDPGTLRMGVGVLEGESANRCRVIAFESIQLTQTLPISERLQEIHRTVTGFIERYVPDCMALENVFFGKNVKSLVKIGEARASAMLAASEKKIPVKEYPPARIKQAVSGNGQASKIQIQQMMKFLFGLKTPPPFDAADALAVALCHLQSQNVRIPVR